MHTNGLRKVRESLAMSQRELGAALNVSHVNINHWEWSQTWPQPRMIARLSARFGISPTQVRLMLTTPEDRYRPPAALRKFLQKYRA